MLDFSDHEFSRRRTLELIWESDEFQYLHMIEPGAGWQNEWKLEFFVNPPENQGWVNVSNSNYTLDQIYQHHNFIGTVSRVSMGFSGICPLVLKAHSHGMRRLDPSISSSIWVQYIVELVHHTMIQ